MFAVGYGLQFCMRVLLRAKRLMKNPSQIPRILVDKKMLSLGLFLGGFPAIFRVSCLLKGSLHTYSHNFTKLLALKHF